uniref:Uncharacterized protein n=3 Tax=unclassified Caudoviricetes TaxID=2788787 RepID=A0AB39U2H2_9CAUD
MNQHVFPDQRADLAIHEGRQYRNQILVSESSLYRLIMRSNVATPTGRPAVVDWG